MPHNSYNDTTNNYQKYHKQILFTFASKNILQYLCQKSLGFKNDNSCNVFSYNQTRVSSLESPKHCVRLMLYINYTKALLKT